MTHEEFMGLRFGDVVCFLGRNYEITKTYNNGISIETNGIVVSGIGTGIHIVFKRQNGLWQISSNNINFIEFDIDKLNKTTPLNQEQNSIEYYEKKIDETKTELNRLSTILNGLRESKRMKELTETLSNLIGGKNYAIVSKGWGSHVNVFIGTYTGTTFEGDRIKIKTCIGNMEYCVQPQTILDIIAMPEIDNLYTNLLSICEKNEIKLKGQYE